MHHRAAMRGVPGRIRQTGRSAFAMVAVWYNVERLRSWRRAPCRARVAWVITLNLGVHTAWCPQITMISGFRPCRAVGSGDLADGRPQNRIGGFTRWWSEAPIFWGGAPGIPSRNDGPSCRRSNTATLMPRRGALRPQHASSRDVEASSHYTGTNSRCPSRPCGGAAGSRPILVVSPAGIARHLGAYHTNPAV